MASPFWHAFFPPGHPAVGTLSTVDGDGAPNAAVVGSARLLDDGRFALALGANRTLANLRQSPRAVFLHARPGATLLAWQGVRLYLQLDELQGEGELFTALQAETERQAGRRAARGLQAVAIFRVTAARPLLDIPAPA